MDGRKIWSALALITVTVGSYTYHQYRSLAHKVTHDTRSTILHDDDGDSSVLDAAAVPRDLINNPLEYVVVSDEASLTVPTMSLRPYVHVTQLLTTYLRFTMSQFGRFPQAYIMKFIFRSELDAAESFDPSKIQTLDFVPGDVVNGGYRVNARTPEQAILEMAMPSGWPAVSGRLIIGLTENDGQTTFYSRTIQWRRKADGSAPLPLERALTRWLHEYASWWLLVEGTKYLCKDD